MLTRRPARRRYDIALWIDCWVGPVICLVLLAASRLLPRRGSAAPERVHRILLLKMWGMGSIVLASPLLERLRKKHPGARIDFVTLAENEAIARLYPEIDRVYTIDLGRGTLRFLLETLRTIRAIRREHYDLLLDLEFFTRFSAIFSFLVAPRRSHGFSAKGKWRGKLHDVQIPFNAYNHVAQNFATLMHGDPMNPVGVSGLAEDEAALPRLRAPEGAWERCRERLAEDRAWRDGRPIVVVNPNAGEMAVERRWPLEHQARLLEQLGAGDRYNLVLIGAPGERDYVESVVNSSGLAEKVVNAAGRIGIPELVALFERALLLVTNDSGPMHIAAAAGTSTVALFGPETPALYRPLRSRAGQRHVIHYLALACSPCMFVHDNKVLSCWFAQARCMTGIRPEQVVASALELAAEASAVRGSGALRLVDG